MMRLFHYLFVFLLLSAAPVLADPYRLAIFGDSLAAGYRLPPEQAFYTRLEEALQQDGYDVSLIHASRSGRTTAQGLSEQEPLIRQKPDGVILELGINDTFSHTDISIISQNLEQLIRNFKDNQIAVLLAGMKTLPNHSPTYQAQFEQMYRDLADRHHLLLYPFFMDGIFDIGSDGQIISDKVLSDQIHPNAAGVDVMVRRILPSVKKLINLSRL